MYRLFPKHTCCHLKKDTAIWKVFKFSAPFAMACNSILKRRADEYILMFCALFITGWVGVRPVSGGAGTTPEGRDAHPTLLFLGRGWELLHISQCIPVIPNAPGHTCWNMSSLKHAAAGLYCFSISLIRLRHAYCIDIWDCNNISSFFGECFAFDGFY